MYLKAPRSPWLLLTLCCLPLAGVLLGWHFYRAATIERHGHGVYGASEPRSPKWPKVRDAYLTEHPTCEACGRDKSHNLNVHHCVPFHLDKSRELSADNLITLCRDCHLLIGHGGDWGAYNPHCREDAALMLKHVHERKYER